MNESGTRVPLIAKWPGRISPGRRDAFFTLMDLLPTLASVAGIPLRHEVDGMDLSHNLFKFMKIKQTDTSYTIIPFGTNGDSFKNAQQRAAGTPGSAGPR